MIRFAFALLIISCISMLRIDICTSKNNKGITLNLTTKSNDSASTRHSTFLFSEPLTMAYFDSRTPKINFPLLYWGKENDCVQDLGMWLKIKYTYKSGAINHLVNQDGWHRNKLSYWCKRLSALGLMHETESGYQCNGLKYATVTLAGHSDNFSVFTIKNSSKQNVILQLRAILIKSKLSQQLFAGQPTDLRNKKLGRKPKQKKVDLFLSDKKAGKLVGRSQATGNRLKKKLNQKKLIRTKKQQPKLLFMNCTYAFYKGAKQVNYSLPNNQQVYFYYSNGNIYQPLADKVAYSEQTLTQKEMYSPPIPTQSNLYSKSVHTF